MSTVDALPAFTPFTSVTWDAPRVGPKDGYIHLPEGVGPEQVASVRQAWQAYLDNPDAGPPVLIGGATFVPWAAYEPQAILSEATEIDIQRDPWPIIGSLVGLANLLFLVAIFLK